MIMVDNGPFGANPPWFIFYPTGFLLTILGSHHKDHPAFAGRPLLGMKTGYGICNAWGFSSHVGLRSLEMLRHWLGWLGTPDLYFDTLRLIMYGSKCQMGALKCCLFLSSHIWTYLILTQAHGSVHPWNSLEPSVHPWIHAGFVDVHLPPNMV